MISSLYKNLSSFFLNDYSSSSLFIQETWAYVKTSSSQIGMIQESLRKCDIDLLGWCTQKENEGNRQDAKKEGERSVGKR